MKCFVVALVLCLVAQAIPCVAEDLNNLKYAGSSIETKMRLFRAKTFHIEFRNISSKDKPPIYDIWCKTEEADFDDFCDLANLVGNISKKTKWKSRYLCLEDNTSSIIVGKLFWKYRTTTEVCRRFNTLVNRDKKYERYLEREATDPSPGKSVINLTVALSKKTLNYLARRTKAWKRKRDRKTLEWTEWEDAGKFEF